MMTTDGHEAPKPHTIPDADKVVTVDSLGFRLHRLVNLMNRPFFSAAPAALGLSTYAWRTMIVIASHPGTSARHIARETGLLPMSVSRTLSLLREEVCVRDEPDPEDQRVSRYWLAPRGQEIYEEFGPFALQRMDEFFGVLDVQQLAALEGLIDVLSGQAERLTKSLKTARVRGAGGFGEASGGARV